MHNRFNFNIKRFAALILATVLVFSIFIACGETDTQPLSTNTQGGNVSEDVAVLDLSAEELIEAMGIGWNLGNTLDAPYGETSWGQPETTEDMIDAICELGFNTIRIPISWGQHTSGDDYAIDEDWMDRVQQIVDWAIDNGMYVIINSHHDNDFYYPSADNHDAAVDYITKIWTQVAERFKDYDQHLIFEPMNEPRPEGTDDEWWYNEWSQDCRDAMQTIMDCNQAFVDVVRASGGNNADRYLMVSTYCASPDAALSDQFELPDDPSDKLLLTVHEYTPYNLCMDSSWAYTSLDDDGRSLIDYYADALYEKFVANGTYVIIGECGCTNKDNPNERYAWAEYFVSTAKAHGMVAVLWDNGHTVAGSQAYGLFDRYNLEVYSDSQQYYKGLMAGLES